MVSSDVVEHSHFCTSSNAVVYAAAA